MRLKISIIIPNYNHASFLRQRLESVYNQTYQDFEVILLDDASTDTSANILEEYKSHPKTTHLIVNKQNSGSPFKQWQKGIALAKGDYIWIAESDDYCELNFLEKIVHYFKENPSVGICYGQTIDVDETGKKILHRIEYTKEFQPNIWETDFCNKGAEFAANYLSVKNVIPNASAVVFKKELVLAGLFSKPLVNMKMCGDWYFWILISLQTNIGFLAEELNYFRNHQSVSRNHSNIEIKKRRLVEESVIRTYLQNNNIDTNSAEEKLYKQWFKLHKMKAIFLMSFYRIKLPKTSIFGFVFNFINLKIGNK